MAFLKPLKSDTIIILFVYLLFSKVYHMIKRLMKELDFIQIIF